MKAGGAAVRIAIGSDDVGRELKEAIAAHLRGLPGGPVCLDLSPAGGGDLDVPEVARLVAESIRRGEADRGVLVCGTGVGMAIAANKVPGIRAAVCHDVYTAEHARNSNDVQVIVFGSRVVGGELAKRVLDAWLAAGFEPNERRRRRMAQLAALERSYRRPTPRSPTRR
ncbi:MAG TPA: RpiB/LacA/LacB family sugar-phosphate isomerase [Actinomycetes bacterium]